MPQGSLDFNGSFMFEPLRTYHEHFGATYDCPTTPKQPWWEDELNLNDYLTLCHHPPDWLVDETNCEEALLAHSCIQLFGHKHLHKLRKVNNSVVLSSGAVHPVRTDKEWDPRYYFLSLEVQGTGNQRTLRVTLYPRVWDKTAHEFIADKGKN
jgi:hypothetical protein